MQTAIGPKSLEGSLVIPEGATGIVIFAHGSGSGRFSPRNNRVAEHFNAAGLATLLLDLLTEDEAADRSNVFDIDLLGGRVVEAVDWAEAEPHTRDLDIGLLGASTGAAAALIAAAHRPHQVAAVVSRGGRPDLATAHLAGVAAPTLLIVGGLDHSVIEMNERALEALTGRKDLRVVPGATHLFEEPGTLEAVMQMATEWFNQYLGKGKA